MFINEELYQFRLIDSNNKIMTHSTWNAVFNQDTDFCVLFLTYFTRGRLNVAKSRESHHKWKTNRKYNFCFLYFFNVECRGLQIDWMALKWSVLTRPLIGRTTQKHRLCSWTGKMLSVHIPIPWANYISLGTGKVWPILSDAASSLFKGGQAYWCSC